MTSSFRSPDVTSFLLNEARQTGILLAAALDRNHRLIAVLQTTRNDPVEPALKGSLNGPSQPLDPAATHRRNHRRNHRPGTLSRITTDPDLQAFVLSLIETATYAQIVAAVAANFPPERRISLSALSRWWVKNGKAPQNAISKSQPLSDVPGYGGDRTFCIPVIKPCDPTQPGLRK